MFLLHGESLDGSNFRQAHSHFQWLVGAQDRTLFHECRRHVRTGRLLVNELLVVLRIARRYLIALRDQDGLVLGRIQ